MFSRRELLKGSASGFGYLAFAALAQAEAFANKDDKGSILAPKSTHFEPRAKRVIFLCMEGAPSHLDTFDYKKQLNADDGKQAPRGIGLRGGKLKGSPFRFERHGENGIWISELFPSVAQHADKLCVLNGMHTDLPNHAQANLQLHCGISQFPRPSMGAWVLYGLGTENQNLPGFVTINPPQSNGGTANYGSSFLPAACQGTRIRNSNFDRSPAVSNLRNRRRSQKLQRTQLDFAQRLNRKTAANLGGDPKIDGLIASYELAFRMQMEMPNVLNLSNESQATLDLYGIDRSSENERNRNRQASRGVSSASFGRQCLLARKLVEAGVRFVEITSRGWDHHQNLEESLRNSCGAVDKPIAGLLEDLSRRGLLNDTLVIWGGEFGRTPYAQGDGRDHNNKGFTIWMAGGGVKPGFVHGQTDDYGYQAIEGRVHVHDWHATILHLLGLDHERLTFPYAGREMRLTDVKGNVVREILA